MDEGGGSEGSAVVYVGHNLPDSITKDHVLHHFKAFVPHINILRSTIITNKAGKRYGKLVFTSGAAVGQAVSQMNGTQICGYKLHVNHWAPKKKEPEGDIDPLSQFLHQRAEATPHHAVEEDDSSDDSKSDISSISVGSSITNDTGSSFTAYIGTNLPSGIQESTLKIQFQSLGYTVKSIRVVTSKKSQTRCAFVAFSSQEALDQAVKQLNGTKLLGYKLSVSHSVDKKFRRKTHEGSSHKQGQRQRSETTPHVLRDAPSVSIRSNIMSESNATLKVYIGPDLPGTIQESTIRQHLQSLGYTVISVEIIISQMKHTRFAAVALSSQEELDQVVKQLDNTSLLGYNLIVSHWAAKRNHKDSPHKQMPEHTPKKQGKPSATGTYPNDLCTVLLRGIPASVDNSLLQTICEAHGKVTSLHMNEVEGTAYVSYSSPELAAAAGIQLNGLPCGGGRLTVVSSASREPPYPGYSAPAQHLDSGYRTPYQPPTHTHQGVPPPQPYGQLPQGDVSIQQRHGSPQHGSGPLTEGIGSPIALGWEPPPQTHRFPPQRFTSPPQGFAPPPQRFGTPPQRFAPPLQRFRTPLQGFAPPPQRFGTPPQRFAPPLQRFRTPPQRLRPQHQNHSKGPMQTGLGQFPQPSPPGGTYPPPIPYHMQPQAPLHESQDLAQHLGQQLSPTAFHSGSSTQAHGHGGVVTVKVSNIHTSASEEDLKCIILSVVPSAKVAFHTTPESTPNYAHVNCADQSDAGRVIESLKGRKFHELPVSVKGKEVRPATSATLPVDMGTAVSVKLSRLPNSMTEKQIGKHISNIQGISSVVLKSVPNQEHSYAYVNCDNGFAARHVVQNLDGMKLLGSMIKATIQQPKKAKETVEVTTPELDTAEEGQEMSQDLYDFFQQRFSKDIASFEAKGGTLLYSEGFLTVRGPETEVSEFYRNAMESVKDGSQSLTADQWGQLMAAKKGGTTLFQELASPFLYNPNVKLDRKENPFMLVIVGFQEAVDAARCHFLSKMDSKLAVDRVKLFALTHLKPDIPDIIEAECAVNLSGFHPGSSELALDSDAGDLTRARLRLLGELEAVFVHKKKLSLKRNLVASAQRFIASHKAQVVLCIYEHGELVLASAKQGSNSADDQLQVTLCGEPRETVTYVYRSLYAKPSCEKVTMSASQFASLNDSAENSVEKLQEEYGIVLSHNSDEGYVDIQGFNSGDVKAVFRILYNSKQTVCKTRALDCSRNEAMYLSHVLLKNPTEEGGELLAALQDECSTTVRGGNKKIVLVGPASSLDSAEKRIKESSLLKGLQSKAFQYSGCNTALLTDLKSTVHSLEESHEVFVILSVRREEDKRTFNVDVTVLGNNAESFKFEDVCQALQDINPSSKTRDLTAAEGRHLKDESFRQLEAAHPVHFRLVPYKHLLIVQSLWPSAILLAFSAIDELLKDTVKVHKKVPVSVAQLKFLREKRMSELDNDVLQVSIGYPEHYILRHKEVNDFVYISISGLQHFVESAAETVNEMVNGFECVEEELQVDCKYKYRWTWEWQEATKLAIEAECDVIVEFPKSSGKSGGTNSETCTVTVRFLYVHEYALQQARDIVKECITLTPVRSVEIDRAQQTEILKALKDKKLTCKGTKTGIQLNKAEGVVHVISPLRFRNGSGVEEMEERLTNYIRKEVSSSAEVDLEPPLSVLIQNRHFKELKKDKTVFFKFTPNRISLSGKTADVEAAKERLKGLVTQLEASMCTQLVPVPKWLQFAIATKEVRSVLNRFEKAHNVLIEVPKDITCIRNELKWEAKVRPEGWSQTCSIQLLCGSLTKEDTDAIVNAANENLELMGGLAGSILKAGGPAIQEECTKYIGAKGQVSTGDAVCLGSGNLSCKKVIHAVGPRWQGGKNREDHALETTYCRSLEVAVENGCLSIAFPAISTGLFHFPIERCAQSAVRALTYFFSVNPDRLSTVKFVLFREADVPPFQGAFQTLLSNQSLSTTVMKDSLTSAAARVKSVPMWMWEDDSGGYQCFTDSLNAQLEQQFAGNPSGSFQIQHEKWSYTMNLGAMTKTNKETGKVRKLRRDAGSLSSQWYWRDDNGLMQPYTASESVAIENIRLRHGAGNSVSINGQNYMFDFEMQVQVNSTTGHKRRIEYRAGQQPATAAATASYEFDPSSPPKASETELAIVVKGCTEDVNTAVVQVQTQIKGMRGAEVLQFSQKFAHKMERCLQDVCARFYVDVDFKNMGSQDRAANLIGWKDSVRKVVEEGRKTLIELMQTGFTEEVHRPPEWDDDDTPLALKEVNPSSAEFGKVLSLMRHTVPNVRIAKLERIQNKWLWTRYSQHRELIKKKNQGTAPELDLFHGTRSNPPNLIYTGEEGFDMRFSAQGMWGMGNYFAVNASYSHAYAYSTGGVRQMFLVKVLVGASYDCQSNSSLRMPPEKPTKTSSLFGVERYDSVSGTTGGSKVYIIYDNLKAYPFYVITYTA